MSDHESNTCIRFHLTAALRQRKVDVFFLSLMSLRFLSLSLSPFSLSLLIQAQKTNKQNSSPFLTPCTGSPLFHFLSCQPELPSYSLTCPISLFPSSPVHPFHLPLDSPVLFFTLPLLLLIFQLRVPPPSPQPPLSAVIKAPRHGSGLYHLLNSSFSCDMISCSSACCRQGKTAPASRLVTEIFLASV